jgi:hypothetical protein
VAPLSFASLRCGARAIGHALWHVEWADNVNKRPIGVVEFRRTENRSSRQPIQQFSDFEEEVCRSVARSAPLACEHWEVRESKDCILFLLWHAVSAPPFWPFSCHVSVQQQGTHAEEEQEESDVGFGGHEVKL